MKKGELVINTTATIVVAIVAISLFLMIIYLRFPAISRALYCRMPFLAQSQKCTETVLQKIRVSVVNNTCPVIDTLLAHSIACWEQGNFGKSGDTIYCYEVSFSPNCYFDLLSEKNITEAIYLNHLCDILPNNDVNPECGASNRLVLLANITREKNILIKYTSHQIVYE